MSTNLIAEANTVVDAPVAEVWDALVNPKSIKQYFFGADVSSDWQVGSPITWKGDWKGKPYEDKGIILEVDPQRRLKYSHFSPLSGLPDKPESYHNVTIDLSEEGGKTGIKLSQDNNSTEEAREHSRKNWEMMLAGLKKFVEGEERS